LGYVSAVDLNGRTIWIADGHRDHGKCFVVRTDERLIAFLELEAAIQRDGRPFPSLVSYARFQTAARFSLRFIREEKQRAFRAGNFCKAKDKESGAGKRSSRYQSHQGDKYATPDSTRGRVDDGPLRADHRRLFMLCWAARASDVLIPRSYLMIEGASRA
jgi:hypothetical protein